MRREERIRKVQKLLDRLIRKKDHEIFWQTTHPFLNASPRDLMGTDAGFRKVFDLLAGMEDGSFT